MHPEAQERGPSGQPWTGGFLRNTLPQQRRRVGWLGLEILGSGNDGNSGGWKQLLREGRSVPCEFVPVLLPSECPLDQSCLHNNWWVLEMAETQDLLKHPCSLNGNFKVHSAILAQAGESLESSLRSLSGINKICIVGMERACWLLVRSGTPGMKRRLPSFTCQRWCFLFH